MVRASMMRLYIGMVAAMVLAGCNCQQPVDECANVAVSFSSPSDGDTVNPTLDVEVRAANRSTALAISSATIAVKLDGAAAFGAEQDATVQLNKALVTGLSLTPGKNQLRATVKTKDPACSGKQATITVTARSTTMAAKVTAVSFPQDANHDGVLNGIELPVGTNLIMAVTASDTTSTTLVRALSGTSAVSVSDASFAGGKATIEIPVLNGTGTFDLFAQLVSGGTAINSASTNPEALGSIRINRVVATCAISNADVLGPNQDATPSDATFGLRATGTLSMNAVSATFGLDAATPVAVTPMNGSVATDFAVSKMGDKTYTLRLTATDSAGNVCTATKLVRVDLQPPVVSLAVASADGGTAVISKTPVNVTVSATGAADGNLACLYRQQGTATRQLMGCAALAGGSVVIPASFSADGLYSLTAEVTDSAKNTGSFTKAVTVSLSVCGLSFTTIAGKPAQCPAFITQLSVGTFQAALTTSAACAGSPISLFADDVLVGINTTGAFTVTSFNGTHTLRGEIPNTAGPATTVSCDFEVNTNAFPVFTLPSTVTTAMFAQAQDLQPGTPGAQNQLAFTATVPNAGRVELCANTSDASIVGANAAACSDGATGWYVYRGKTNITSPDPAFTFAEGTYHLRLVVVAVGGSFLDSVNDLSLVVDVTAPCLTSGGVTLPQDTAPADNRLNAAELGSAAPRVAFAIDPACGSASSARVRSATSATVYSATVASPATPLTIDLTSVPTTADLDVYVELADALGNVTTAASPFVRKAFQIDRDVPTCTLTAPSKTTLNIVDVPSGRLPVQVQTSSDVAAVTVSLGAGAPVSATVMAPTYVAATSFMISGTQTQTLAATCKDPAGNQATASLSLSYDLDAPTCAFTAPAANSVSTSNDITTTLTVGGAEGQTVHISTSAQAPEVGTLIVSGGTATGVIVGYPNGLSQTLTATVSDAAGNPCTTTVGPVSINSTSCNLLTNAVSNGTTLWLNLANSTASGPGRSADIVATSNCTTGQTVTLARTQPTGAVLGTKTTNASGSVTFTAAQFSDGDVFTVSIDNGAGVITTRTITADFTLPAVASVSINSIVPAASTLYFVAPGTGVNAQNRHVQLGDVNYFPDSDATAAGAQFSLTVTSVTGGTASGAPGSLAVLFNGNPVLTALPVTSSNQTFTGLASTLPQDGSAMFIVRAIDQAGNSIDAFSQTATIDVVPPSKPGNIARALASARDAKVSIAWDPVGDDGTTGTVKDYDVRWTTSSVNCTVIAPATSCVNMMTSDGEYFGGSSYRDSPTLPSATRVTRLVDVPPLNTYYVAVRARDELDNYSAFEVPAGVDNPWTKLTLSGVAGTSFGDTVASGGSLNGDTTHEVVVTAQNFTIAGSVFVYYGGVAPTLGADGGVVTPGTPFVTQTTCVSPACTTLTPPSTGAQLGFAFGTDVSLTGNVGDTAGEGKADLIVTQRFWPDLAGAGRVFLYFGTTGATIDPVNFIEFRGTLAPVAKIGNSARIIKDIDNDGIDDLLLPSPGTSSVQGHVYIFKGRSAAAWRALRTGVDGTTSALYVPISSADYVIDGPPTQGSGWFARPRFGVTSLGDLNGDGRSEFTIPMGPSVLNELRLYSPSANATPTVLQSLTLPPSTDATPQDGFGAVAIGGFNLINGSANDLITSWPVAAPLVGEVYIYADLGSSGAPSTYAVRILGTQRFGSSLSAGSVNTGEMTPSVDLLVGTTQVTNSNAWLLWNHLGSFDTPINTNTGNARFWVTRFDGTALAGGVTSNSVGQTNALTDISGDGLLDVVLADVQNNVVYIWR